MESLRTGFDENFQMGESIVIETIQEFTHTIVHTYGDRYLRTPNEHDISRLLAQAEERGFPDTIGSIDCMH